MSGSFDLSMAQIQADLFMAGAAITEAEKMTPKAAKYIKGQAGYHLQQAAEKMVKIQLYASGKTIDPAKVYKHRIDQLIAYANSLNISLILPSYVDKNAVVISSWEAEGRYDIHFVVKINQLKRCLTELNDWFILLHKNGYK